MKKPPPSLVERRARAAPAATHILDNRGRTVVDCLRQGLAGAGAFRLVSAYFSIYGYELLADELDTLEEARILFGDPTSVDELDPGEKDPKSFELTERGLVPTHVLRQKALARRCRGWIEGPQVMVRSISRSNFLHGKMYLTGGADTAAAVVGSSNFTRSGLGGGLRPNLEINLATTEPAGCRQLLDWFDDLWNDPALTADVKQAVLTALDRIGKEYGPQVIYFKTLLELFREQIEARLEESQRLGDIDLHDTAIWKTLYDFQKEGARSIIARLRRNNGCILADSVGLGKTYTALAVIKYFELRNENVLVLCPRRLRDNWSLYPASNAHRDNPFLQDRFGYSLLSHTDLSRDQGMAGNVDLASFNWGGFDLVVIDESHNFRNDGGQRYKRLIEEIICKGARTKVLMLSATPVNTSLIDLRNQIHLMTGGRTDAFRDSLGLADTATLLAAAQREFRDWEAGRDGRRDKARLLESLGADFLRLLDAVSIARSRPQIERFYSREMERIGPFPSHARPDNRYPPTDLEGRLSYKELADRIGRFEMSVYRPTRYLTDETRIQQLAAEREELNFNQRDRESFLVGMIRTNFLKRLESSPRALALTLGRTVDKIDGLIARIDRYEDSRAASHTAETLPDEDDEDGEFFINRARHPYHLSELDRPGWRADLLRDRDTLNAARGQVAAITAERDGKLRELRRVIRHKAENPTTDKDGRTNRKVLVFTTFKDTAEYLYAQLAPLAGELGLKMAMVAGDATRTTLGDNHFNAILTNFAPRARGRSRPGEEIDLLVATDCISEGQNLQDCDTTLNYDIHWNPVRLIQRFGRIDRIGSRNKQVRMLNFWPTRDMDAYLRLEDRVRARMMLADMAASGADDPLTEKGAKLELNFRDRQLLRLRDEILDLDELDDSPAMSDFTLDYFFAQLLQYLQQNREELEQIPVGAYAIAPAAAPAAPGVIFFLRQRRSQSRPGQRMASPVHPFYLVFIQEDGDIRFGCANTRQALGVFEAASAGRPEPLLDLCDAFNRETENGRNMERYDELLKVVIAHIARAHGRTQAKGLGLGGSRGFQLPPASQAPKELQDFELVTWLAIKDGA